MKLKIIKEHMLELLNTVSSVVERRGTLAILSNIKLTVEKDKITVLGSDLEVELIASTKLGDGCCLAEGETTIPAKKLLEIIKALPAKANVTIEVSNDERCKISSNKSKFVVGTLPPDDFPLIEKKEISTSNPKLLSIQIAQFEIKRLFEKTSFAMAVQDVRFYLTGTLFDYGAGILKAVTTDGHRLAYCETTVEANREDNHAVIIPKKGVVELQRLTAYVEDKVELRFSTELINLNLTVNKEFGAIDIQLTSKLIDGKYPDYRRVIPVGNNKQAILPSTEFKQTLQRAAILSHEKMRGLNLSFEENLLTISARNAEQDEAIESLDIEYTSPPITIGFNGTYLTDAIGCIQNDSILMEIGEETKSVLVKDPLDSTYQYVVMPMRI